MILKLIIKSKYLPYFKPPEARSHLLKVNSFNSLPPPPFIKMTTPADFSCKVTSFTTCQI
jgi:hypothetical protein